MSYLDNEDNNSTCLIGAGVRTNEKRHEKLYSFYCMYRTVVIIGKSETHGYDIITLVSARIIPVRAMA